MTPSPPERLRAVRRFEDLVRYLEEELDWPLGEHAFEDLTFEYEPKELGLKDETIAEGTKIRQLRPLKTGQPWGIFFVEFPKKRLPVLVLRRILQNLVIKKRASAQKSKAAAWDAKDLLFISAFGDEAGGEREIAFGHFHEENGDKPVLRVLDWDGSDTPLKLARLDDTLKRKLKWPERGETADVWRTRWSSAFRLRLNHVIKTSDRMADILAGFARGIRQKVLAGLAAETDKGPLHVLLEDFRKSLLHDLKEADFADTYAQTVTYGLLSLAITKTQAGQPKTLSAGHLVSEVPLTSPFLKEILGELLKRGGRKGGLDYDELGLHEVVEFLNSDETDLPAILADFGNKTAADDPVIHFYEHFLTAYDKKLKIQRGVFYTPRPVVSCIVRRAHELLQTEFGLVDGLADTATWGWMADRHPGLVIPDGAKATDRFVTILDPATGTATFLVEVIDVIYRTLLKKWKGEGHSEKKCEEMWNAYVPEHLLPRLYGYELLMAPYAIAHLKIGLKLAETGYTFGTPAIARVFLTNALEPPSERKLVGLGLMALAHEAEAVSAVKRAQRFTVVVGNPPYSSVSQNMGVAIWEMVNQYLVLPTGPIEERSNRNHLQDDYVKFLRLAQACVEACGVGLVGMITNSSYLAGAWYRGMRFHLLEALPLVEIVDLHGGKGFIRSAALDDQNVFEIMQSVAIGLLGLTPTRRASVLYRALVGGREGKYERLLAGELGPAKSLAPGATNRWALQPFSLDMHSEWQACIGLEDVFAQWGDGAKTNRDGLAVAFSGAELEQQIQRFADLSIADLTLENEMGFGSNYQWKTGSVRRRFAALGVDPLLVSKYAYRPFDTRFIYWHPAIVFNMRGGKLEQLRSVNPPIALLFSRTTTKDEYTNFFVTRSIPDMQILYNTKVAPLFCNDVAGTPSLLDGGARINLKVAFRKKLAHALSGRAGPDQVESGETPEAILAYMYSTFHSSEYRRRYSDFLRIDFPRVPLPGGPELFRGLARLGSELMALHLLESPAIEQRFGTYTGPSSPRVGRVAWSDDAVWIDAPAPKKGQPARPGTVGFRGVPEEVWNFHIGGYQVCEKWLKDRKGRILSVDDITLYKNIVVALAETIRLMKEIDKVIEEHGGWPGAFQTGDAMTATVKVVPFQPLEEPKPEERYVTALPLVPLKAAAGAFGDPQKLDDDEAFTWVSVDARHRLRPGMFVAQVIGKSMEPMIPDGAFCVFARPLSGTLQGRTILVKLRDQKDPETGERFTVKRYESEKVPDEESWRHARITLKPVNPDFKPIVLDGGEGDLEPLAEFIEVLGNPNATDRG